MPDDNFSPGASFKRMIAVIIAAVILAMGIAAHGDTIRLHAEAGSRGPDVRLREVAELQGPLAEFYADTVVHRFGADAEARLSMESVRRTLTEAGVNWGLVSLTGYASCRLHHLADEPRRVERVPAEATPVVVNPRGAVSVDQAGTLRALVTAKIAQLAGVPAEELRITFSERDVAALRRSTLGSRFEIEPRGEAIGRLPLVIRRYERDEVVETLSISADVERRATVVVATRSIGRGDRFTKDNVALREVFLRDDRGQPITDLDLVLGQTAASLLREGHVLYPPAVESPLMVRRGELITVRCISGGLAIRTVARAGADGHLNDVIEVRNESTRQTYTAAVTGPREVTIQLGGASVAAAVQQSANQQEVLP